MPAWSKLKLSRTLYRILYLPDRSNLNLLSFSSSAFASRASIFRIFVSSSAMRRRASSSRPVCGADATAGSDHSPGADEGRLNSAAMRNHAAKTPAHFIANQPYRPTPPSEWQLMQRPSSGRDFMYATSDSRSSTSMSILGMTVPGLTSRGSLKCSSSHLASRRRPTSLRLGPTVPPSPKTEWQLPQPNVANRSCPSVIFLSVLMARLIIGVWAPYQVRTTTADRVAIPSAVQRGRSHGWREIVRSE